VFKPERQSSGVLREPGCARYVVVQIYCASFPVNLGSVTSEGDQVRSGCRSLTLAALCWGARRGVECSHIMVVHTTARFSQWRATLLRSWLCAGEHVFHSRATGFEVLRLSDATGPPAACPVGGPVDLASRLRCRSTARTRTGGAAAARLPLRSSACN
jgi:hypothetical protein